MPYSRYFEAKKQCRFNLGQSSQCGECVKIGKPYDSPSIISSYASFSFLMLFLPLILLIVSRNISKQRKVRKAQEAAKSQLHKLLRRLLRLRRQEASLQEKGAKLFERGIQEERDEEKEVAKVQVIERQQVISEAQSLGAYRLIDQDAISFDFSTPILASPGSFDRTKQVVPNSSQGS